MVDEIRKKLVDHQANEHREHDSVRGIGKASEDFATLAGAAAYPATLLEFYLPDTAGATPFGVTAVKRDNTKQYARLRNIHIYNLEADVRTFIFYDGDPGGAAGTFKLLFTKRLAATSTLELNETQLGAYMLTYGLYVDPSGTKTAGVEISAATDIINKEVTE